MVVNIVSVCAPGLYIARDCLRWVVFLQLGNGLFSRTSLSLIQSLHGNRPLLPSDRVGGAMPLGGSSYSRRPQRASAAHRSPQRQSHVVDKSSNTSNTFRAMTDIAERMVGLRDCFVLSHVRTGRRIVRSDIRMKAFVGRSLERCPRLGKRKGGCTADGECALVLATSAFGPWAES